LEFAAAEVEPNDERAQATQSIRNYFRGSLLLPAPSTDIDIFAVEAKAGDELFVSLDSDPLRDNTPMDAKLSIWQPNGSVLLEVDDPNGSSSTNRTTELMDAFSPRSPSEALVFRATTNGTYYVQVSAGAFATGDSDGAGDYLLSIAINCSAGKAGQRLPAQFRSVSRSGTNSVVLGLQGAPGASYRVIASNNLTDWTTLGIGVGDAMGRFEITDTAGAAPASVFYRTVWP
jgi:hypothetical protein